MELTAELHLGPDHVAMGRPVILIKKIISSVVSNKQVKITIVIEITPRAADGISTIVRNNTYPHRIQEIVRCSAIMIKDIVLAEVIRDKEIRIAVIVIITPTIALRLRHEEVLKQDR